MRKFLMPIMAAIVFSANAQGALAVIDALGPADEFRDDAECAQAIKEATKDPAGLYRAGRYLMAKAYGSKSGKALSKKAAFDYCRKAYGCFEAAWRLEQGNSAFAAWSGAARLLSCAYGSVFDAIQNGSIGVSAYKKAIALDPQNPGIRLLRARSYVYLPRAYYPDCDSTILEDTQEILSSGDWPREMGDKEAAIEEASCYRCIAFKQEGKEEEYGREFANLRPDGRFAAIARNWKKR